MNGYRAYPPEGFETVGDAQRRRKRLIRVLAKQGKDHRPLTRKLAMCRNGTRCKSGACPSCLRLFRVNLLREGVQVLECRRDWVRVSIVPREMTAPKGDLNQLNLTRMMKTCRKRLERCLTGSLVIGGIDFSLNSSENANLTWQAHLYLLIEGKLTEALEQKVRKAFAAEPTAKRPYLFTQLYSHRKPLTYCLKPVFTRRSEYHAKGKSRIADQALKADHIAELALYLDQYPIGQRLILRGFRRAGRRLKVTS